MFVAAVLSAGVAASAVIGRGGLAASPASHASVTQDSSAYERGRRYNRWLLAGSLDSLADRIAPTFLRAVGGVDGLRQLRERLVSQAGDEAMVEREAVYVGPGATDYYRVARFSKVPDTTFTARWVWTTGDTIAGASVIVTPAPAPSEHLTYHTTTRLRLPFASGPNASWYVAWGGRRPDQNYHITAPDQRFAYDFVLVRDDRVHTGRGTANAEYHCFGAPVLAPAAGVVVQAVDSIADNVPGQRNRVSPPGNYVVIDHGEDERSFIAHFRRGSVRVRPGERLAASQRIGECGNSGNSTLPHVHYHLQTGTDYGQGVGLPASFNDYIADGRRIVRGQPTRGEYLKPGS